MRERVNSPQMDNEYQLSVTPILLFFAVKEESRFFCQYLKQQGYFFDNLKKFSHKLNYNVCALVSNDVAVHSPLPLTPPN